MLDAAEDDGAIHDRLRRAETIGRPLGNPAVLDQVEAQLGRSIDVHEVDRSQMRQAIQRVADFAAMVSQAP